VEGLGMATSLLIGHAWRKSMMKMNVHPQHSLDLYVMAQTAYQCSSLVMEQEGFGGLMQLKGQPSCRALVLELSQNLCQEIIGGKNH